MSETTLIGSKQKIQEAEYDRPYHWMLNRNGKLLYDLRTRKVLEFLQGAGNLKDKRCLDVGCGDGKFTSTLLSIDKDTLGNDYSKRAIRLSRNLVPEATFLATDASQLCFKDETFDLITCLDVMEHLLKDRRKKAIQEMYRVIKKRARAGYIILSSTDLGIFQQFGEFLAS